MSDDRLIRILTYLATLLFVSAGVLPLARGRYPKVKWARWGAIGIFSIAVVYALVLTIGWGLNRGY